MNIEGVVLAAGYSSRAGTFKLELDIGGKTVIEHCIEGMYDICSRIIVVGGYQIHRIIEILKEYPKAEVVLNSRYAEGMFTSVKEGMRHVRGDRFFFTPGDYPMISRMVCQRLLTVEGDIILPAYGGRKGHPVLMMGRLAKELLMEPDSLSLRDFIHRKGYRVLEVEEEGILTDIDTQEDYKRMMERYL